METVTFAEEELTTMKYVNESNLFTVEEINSFFFYEVSWCRLKSDIFYTYFDLK